MNVILTADWHIRHNPPVCRTDDYLTAQWKRLEELFSLAELYSAPILVAGDVFDRWNPPISLVRDLLRMINAFDVEIIAIAGNHDLPQHQMDNYEKSALALLETASEKVTVFRKGDHWQYLDAEIDMTVSGNSFGENYTSKDPHDIHMEHMMVWHEKPPYPGAPELGNVLALLHNDAFDWADVVLTGDNHKTFHVKSEGRIWINPGSLMRMTAAQMDHRPCCFVLDHNLEVNQHFFDEPEGVIDTTHITVAQEHDERQEIIQGFIQRVNEMEGDDSDIDFWKNLDRFFHEHKTDKETQKIILEAKQ